jgi:predicted transcriptional regulator
LTLVHNTATNSFVTIRAGENLKALLKRVNLATSARGKKKDLAKFLRVSRVSVSQWLSLSRAPNGEVTLLMQEWVNAQEKNKNALGDASNTAKSKTRSTQSKYEKEKRVRRRKYRGGKK